MITARDTISTSERPPEWRELLALMVSNDDITDWSQHFRTSGSYRDNCELSDRGDYDLGQYDYENDNYWDFYGLVGGGSGGCLDGTRAIVAIDTLTTTDTSIKMPITTIIGLLANLTSLCGSYHFGKLSRYDGECTLTKPNIRCAINMETHRSVKLISATCNTSHCVLSASHCSHSAVSTAVSTAASVSLLQ